MIESLQVGLCRRVLLLLHSILLRGNNLRFDHPCLFYHRPGFISRCPDKGHPFRGATLGLNPPPPRTRTHTHTHTHTHTFSTPQVGLPLASHGCGATNPLLSAGSTQLLFHLPGSHPRNVTAVVTAPTLAGPDVSVPHSLVSADAVEQDMDVSRLSFGDTFFSGRSGSVPSALCSTGLPCMLISGRMSIY